MRIAALLAALSLAPIALTWSATAPAQLKVPSAMDVPSTEEIPAFDVVSIRPSGQGETAAIKILPDGYQAKHMPLDNTILLAYFPAPYFKHRDELKGGPTWVHSDLYDIQARVSPADLPKWTQLNQNMMQTPTALQAMLRAMLAERFNLALHAVPSQTSGYALVLSNHKLALQRDTAPAPSTGAGMQLPGGGKAVSSLRDNRTVWTFSHASMQALLGFLSLSADGPLVDRTGLQGNYSFELTGIDPGQSEPADPALVVPFDLQALGLKLQRVKVPTESWVIDRIQRPTAN